MTNLVALIVLQALECSTFGLKGVAPLDARRTYCVPGVVGKFCSPKLLL